MRGNPQRVDLNEEGLVAFLQQIRMIDVLVLSGGEPSLAPKQIAMVAHYMRELHVGVFKLEVITNGKRITKPFLDALHMFEDRGRRLCLAYGGSFHDHVPEQSIKMLRNELVGWSITPQGSSLPLHREGRAASDDNLEKLVKPDGSGRTLMMCPIDLKTKFNIQDNDIRVRPLYLNALGYVLPHTDFSYESQKKYALCHASDDILEAAKNW
jgi:hypothetical protein